MAIADAIETLKTESVNAESRYRELVADVAGGKKPGPDDLAVLSTLGRSIDQFKLDCDEAAANEADKRAVAEATRLAREVVPEAQQAASVAYSAAQTIGNAIDAITAAVTAAVRPEVERRRSYVAQIIAEMSVLRSRRNWFSLVGRREKIKQAEYALEVMPQRYGDPRFDQSGTKHEIDWHTAELERMRAEPMTFTTTSRLPPAPEPVDLYMAATGAMLMALAKTIPADKLGEILRAIPEIVSTMVATVAEATPATTPEARKQE